MSSTAATTSAPKLSARVQDVIESLGYSPNQAARILKGHRTKTIGLVLPSIADPFMASCAEAAQVVARENDSLLIVTTTHNDAKMEIDNLNLLIRHRTDGLLIVPANSHGPALRDLLNRTITPVVAIDRPVHNSSIASVVADNFQGACIATQHLVDHGYKRIVCLTGESVLYTIRERINGYRETIEAASLPCLIDTTVKDYKSAEHAIKTLLASPNPPDAFFTLKNSITIYAFEVLQRFDIAVPEQVALLGYDDFELASTVRPSISVIEQPAQEIGRIAAELLFEQLLDGGSAASPVRPKSLQQVKLQTRLIRRSSCGCTPVQS